ncbi:MAG: histidine phosphatase family protein [Anaerolineae bacterium]|nr:histidine phosphatase family protein [Anaerolineae bacterium]
MMHLILAHYGETDWSRDGRFQGRAQVELNATGIAQAGALESYIRSAWTPDAVYCSPLRRARQTAEVIGNRFMLHERSHPGFLDIDYGAWQGLTPVEIEARWSQALRLWYAQPHLAPIPGGEMLDSVRLRVRGALHEIVDRHQNDTVVIVSHTVVNRLLLLEALGLDNAHFWHLCQEIGSFNLLDFDGEFFTLVKMNVTCHLKMTNDT